VRELARLVQQAKHMVIYTGAGISTSAKIPDYRGPQGVWTLRDKGMAPKIQVTLEQALPTPTHMAILALEQKGLCRFVVSTNVDGLHRRAGTNPDKLAELHGNCYKEICSVCKKEYLMTFNIKGGNKHKTGRVCEENGCNGDRIDSIINFGENLPVKELEITAEHANKSDFALVLGTSMLVRPACMFPEYAVSNGGKMVIVNLQKTPYDDQCHVVIRERTDKVMQMLFAELGMTIPEYNEEADIIFLMKQGILENI